MGAFGKGKNLHRDNKVPIKFIDPTAAEKVQKMKDMQNEKLKQFMDHRAVIFSDRTYIGPMKKDNVAALKQKQSAALSSGVRPLMPYGSKQVVAPKQTACIASDDDMVELDFGSSTPQTQAPPAKKLAFPNLKENKKTNLNTFMHRNQGSLIDQIKKRRKVWLN